MLLDEDGEPVAVELSSQKKNVFMTSVDDLNRLGMELWS